jgi:branched-chain amino acid transport system permease protein
VEVVDKQVGVYLEFQARLRARVRALLTPEVIAEHEANPLGPHSDALQRVLNYFRQQPQPGKYILVAVTPWEDYRIAVLSGRRGQVHKVLDDERFASEEAGLHGIFLRRVRDLREADA